MCSFPRQSKYGNEEQAGVLQHRICESTSGSLVACLAITESEEYYFCHFLDAFHSLIFIQITFHALLKRHSM